MQNFRLISLETKKLLNFQISGHFGKEKKRKETKQRIQQVVITTLKRDRSQDTPFRKQGTSFRQLGTPIGKPLSPIGETGYLFLQQNGSFTPFVKPDTPTRKPGTQFYEIGDADFTISGHFGMELKIKRLVSLTIYLKYVMIFFEKYFTVLKKRNKTNLYISHFHI